MKTFARWMEANIPPESSGLTASDLEESDRLFRVSTAIKALKEALEIIENSNDNGYKDITVKQVAECLPILQKWHEVSFSNHVSDEPEIRAGSQPEWKKIHNKYPHLTFSGKPDWPR